MNTITKRNLANRVLALALMAAMLLGMGAGLAAQKKTEFTKLDSFKMTPSTAKITPRQRFVIRASESSDESASLSDIAVTTSKKGVASVDSNWMVTGEKAGKVDVVLQARNGKGKDVVKVEVVAPGKGYTLNLAADKKALAAVKTKPLQPHVADTYFELSEKTRALSTVKPFLTGEAKAYTFKKSEEELALSLYASTIYTQALIERDYFFEHDFIALNAEDYPDLSASGQRALRAWLRQALEIDDLGSVDDLVLGGLDAIPEGFDGSIMNPFGLDYFGGVMLGVEHVAKIDASHYIVGAVAYYGPLKARGYDMYMTLQKDGSWDVVASLEAWVS